MTWFNNIFAVNRHHQISASKFNHCSAVCPHRDGSLVAWYSGTAECNTDQSVHVVFVNKHTISDPFRVGDGTGNPVLWEDGDDAIMIWSRFEDTGPIRSLADRWKYCSLWFQRIAFDGNEFVCNDAIQIAKASQHLLGRCSPVRLGKRLLLPLYDEVARECVIFDATGLQFEEISRFGHNMIQPTIWEHDSTLCALSRNFGGPSHFAYLCESTNGASWSKPTMTSIPNRNNSLQVINWADNEIVMWNNTLTTGRQNMTVGYLSRQQNDVGFEELQAIPISVIGKRRGAYPSMCVDAEDNLNITFSNASRSIDHHVWNRRYFKSRRRIS